MGITVNQSGEVKEAPLDNPVVLSLDKENRLLITLTRNDGTQQVLALEDYLDLTDIERREVEMYKKLGYTLVGERRIGQDYPDYFKKFHEQYEKWFASGKEMYLQRDQFQEDTSDVIFPDREKRELIFVKLNFPQTASPKVTYRLAQFNETIAGILGNIGLGK